MAALTAFALAFALPPSIHAAAATAASAAKTNDDPQTLLRAAVDEVLALAYPATPADPASPAPAVLATRVRPVLEKYFSFDLLTRSAVGPAWRDFTAEQQKKITTLFTEIVIRSYAEKFEPGARPAVAYARPNEVNATTRELPTTVALAGKTFAVAYRFRQLPEGWRIYDVNIEGVSMVANYRAQFDPIAQKKDGAAALIAALEKNISDFNAGKK
jgi:phospholipid transport system substrate-binding protein